MSLQSQPQPSSRYRQAQKRRCAKSDCQQEGLFPAPSDSNSDSEGKNTRAWLCLKHARAANSAWNYYEHKSNEDVEQALRDSAVGYRPTWPMNPYGKRNGDIWDKHSHERQKLKNTAWRNSDKRNHDKRNYDKSFANIFVDIFGENSSNSAPSNEQQQRQKKAQERTQEKAQGKAQGKAQEKYFDARQNNYDNDHRIPRNSEEKKACRILELTPPINAKELKARYRALAKAHHPDHHTANGSDNGSAKSLAKNPDEQTSRQKQERLKQINVAYSLLQGLWSM